ncbi:MAG: hypothetical protein ABSF26_24850 [Thermoguttaceae bacterium]|jgi:hypothetical protein
MPSERLIATIGLIVGLVAYFLISRRRSLAFDPLFAAEASVSVGFAVCSAYLAYGIIDTKHFTEVFRLYNKDGLPISVDGRIDLDLAHYFDILLGVGMSLYFVSLAFFRAIRHGR